MNTAANEAAELIRETDGGIQARIHQLVPFMTEPFDMRITGKSLPMSHSTVLLRRVFKN